MCVCVCVYVCVYACAKSFQLCLTHCNLMDCSPSGSSFCEDSPGNNTGVGCHASSKGSSHLTSPALAGGFFTTSASWEVPPLATNAQELFPQLALREAAAQVFS